MPGGDGKKVCAVKCRAARTQKTRHANKQQAGRQESRRKSKKRLTYLDNWGCPGVCFPFPSLVVGVAMRALSLVVQGLGGAVGSVLNALSFENERGQAGRSKVLIRDRRVLELRKVACRVA